MKNINTRTWHHSSLIFRKFQLWIYKECKILMLIKKVRGWLKSSSKVMCSCTVFFHITSTNVKQFSSGAKNSREWGRLNADDDDSHQITDDYSFPVSASVSEISMSDVSSSLCLDSVITGVGRIRLFGATKSSTGVLFSPFKEFRLNLRKRRHSKFSGLRRSLLDPATSLAVLNIRSEAADPGGQQWVG